MDAQQTLEVYNLLDMIIHTGGNLCVDGLNSLYKTHHELRTLLIETGQLERTNDALRETQAEEPG